MDRHCFKAWIKDGIPGGLRVRTHSPGDAITRYRFFRRSDIPDKDLMYCSDFGIYTALGVREACTFLEGWLARGRDECLNS